MPNNYTRQTRSREKILEAKEKRIYAKKILQEHYEMDSIIINNLALSKDEIKKRLFK